MPLLTSLPLRLIAGAAAALGLIGLLGAKSAPAPAPASFDEINVQRINVREPDGTLRMVISNRAQFPGSPFKGGMVERPDRKAFAGMLFVNDEGTENGGLIQRGALGDDGQANAGLSLSFDRFRQDQVIQLLHQEAGGRASSMLAINDEADGSKLDVFQRSQRMAEIRQLEPAAQEREFARMQAAGQLPANRVRLGTTGDKGAALSLADAQGRPRLLLLVTAEGQPSIAFLDERGAVRRSIDLSSK